MINLGKLQDQLSLVSSYTANVYEQMEVLGDAYIGSKSFISQLGTINLLTDNLQQDINDVLAERDAEIGRCAESFNKQHIENRNLRAELEEVNKLKTVHPWCLDRIVDLERQLAERDAEIAEIYKIYNYAIDEQASLKAKITFWQSENKELRSKLAEYLEEVKMPGVPATKVICLANDLQEVRKQAAREVIELMGGWSLQNSTLITCRGIVARHFKLEG